MTPKRPRVGGVLSTKKPLREPDGAAGGDFVWPPPADDPATCSIVLLDSDDVARPQSTAPADEPGAAFPEIDIESALDAFADPPAAPKVPPTGRPALPYSGPSTRPAAVSRWTAAWRSIVGLGLGGSLALMLPPGLGFVGEARLLPVPAKTEPRVTTSRGIGTRDRLVAPHPSSQPRLGTDGPRDEDRIRTTLAQLRTAYAQLDAGAAREVWPSVDVEALARAFEGLKSQELRFDHCDVTVEGARARAACTGEAVYVPRVGTRSFTSAARAWTFELRRRHERWMIASGRAS